MVERTLDKIEYIIEKEFEDQEAEELDYLPNHDELWISIREDNAKSEYTKRYRSKYE